LVEIGSYGTVRVTVGVAAGFGFAAERRVMPRRSRSAKSRRCLRSLATIEITKNARTVDQAATGL